MAIKPQNTGQRRPPAVRRPAAGRPTDAKCGRVQVYRNTAGGQSGKSANFPPELYKKLQNQKLGSGLCQGNVVDTYVQNSLERADVVMLTQTPRGRVCGLALLYYRKHFLYVDVICSSVRGQGSLVLGEAEKFAAGKGYGLIKLSALPSVVGFYEKKGYREVGNACKGGKEKRIGNDIDGYRMTKCLACDARSGACKHGSVVVHVKPHTGEVRRLPARTRNVPRRYSPKW